MRRLSEAGEHHMYFRSIVTLKDTGDLAQGMDIVVIQAAGSIHSKVIQAAIVVFIGHEVMCMLMVRQRRASSGFPE